MNLPICRVQTKPMSTLLTGMLNKENTVHAALWKWDSATQNKALIIPGHHVFLWGSGNVWLVEKVFSHLLCCRNCTSQELPHEGEGCGNSNGPKGGGSVCICVIDLNVCQGQARDHGSGHPGGASSWRRDGLYELKQIGQWVIWLGHTGSTPVPMP